MSEWLSCGLLIGFDVAGEAVIINLSPNQKAALAITALLNEYAQQGGPEVSGTSGDIHADA